MEFMLTISTDTLPQSSLSYVAFRVAFLETLERMTLAQQMGAHEAECLGFLTEVPFLKATAPHVQLDALAETWCKHMSDDPFDATLVDEAVVYAVCETASRIVESRCAITKLVRSVRSAAIACCSNSSVRVSTELVASSRISSAGSARNARAIVTN